MRKEAVAAAAAIMTLAVPCTATDAFTWEKVSLSGRGEYGFNLQGGTLNPYALGLGARGGYTLGMGLYLGGSADLFLGASKSVLGNEIDADHFQIMGEAGYDLGLGDLLVLRPLGAVGLGRHAVGFCFEESGVCGNNAETGVVLGAGANLMVDLGGFFLGADTRLNWLVGNADESTSLILGISAGASF